VSTPEDPPGVAGPLVPTDDPRARSVSLSRRDALRTAGAAALSAAITLPVFRPRRAEAAGGPGEARTIFFDVGGTMLDWTVMPSRLETFFSERGIRVDGDAFWLAWRTKLFFYMMYNTMIDAGFVPLEELGRRTTLAVTTARGVALPPEDAELVLPLLGELDLYPDVLPGLRQLRQLGYQLVPHTQLSLRILRRALLPRFEWDAYFTSETFARYKPERTIYTRAFETLGLDASEVVYVTSNQFDVFGSKGVGARTAWVDRWGEPFEPYGYEPDWHVRDFEELAGVLEAAGA